MFLVDDEVLVMVNDVLYVLVVLVWMIDYVWVMWFLCDFDFGCVWINMYILFVLDMLYGGFKYFGYGKDFL